MNNLTIDNPFGVKFFRFSNLQPLNINGYFSCLNLIKPLFERQDFKDSTSGFYINYITNSEDGNSVRLTYFTNNKAETSRAIKNFLNTNSNIVLFPSKDSYESGKGNIAEGYGGENLRFRRFLNAYTQIGLDLLGYNILYSRRLAAEYRLNYSTQKISCKPLFESAFTKHSKFFNQLDTSSIEQLWKDLNFWHTIKNTNYVADWAHFLVNMLLPGDFTDIPYFVGFFRNPNPEPPIIGKQKIIMLKIFNLDIPDNWIPDD